MNTDVVLKQICAEKWDNQMSHLLYSIGLMIVQVIGGFQLVDLVITELKNHMTYQSLIPLIG